MIIADRTAKPMWVGADLCAQAEHGSGKEKLYLICENEEFAHRCLSEVVLNRVVFNTVKKYEKL
jgi:histidinol dehydrogenase